MNFMVDYGDSIAAVEEQVDENYDPSEMFLGLATQQMPANGGGDHLQDDLAVSDDSEDEGGGQQDDDPMAF